MGQCLTELGHSEHVLPSQGVKLVLPPLPLRFARSTVLPFATTTAGRLHVLLALLGLQAEVFVAIPAWWRPP